MIMFVLIGLVCIAVGCCVAMALVSFTKGSFKVDEWARSDWWMMFTMGGIVGIGMFLAIGILVLLGHG